MRIFFILLITLEFLLCQDELLKAQQLEEAGQYKEAMLIYKALALEAKADNHLGDQLEAKSKEPISSNQTLERKKKKLLSQLQGDESKASLEQMLSSQFNITPYKDNYFLPFSYDSQKRDDRKQWESKFQFSIKKELSEDFLGLNEQLFFAYTQKSWWQTFADSGPFRETNYAPEFFVLVPYSDENSSLLAYKAGILHESNGQGGTQSKSWNRLYLEGIFQVGNLFVTPRAWYRIPEGDQDDNPDIEDYLGYGDLSLKYFYNDQIFSLLLRNNLKLDDDNKGFAELNYSVPFGSSKTSFFYLQLSTGYGDSLIDYKEEVNRFSFGVALSR